MIVDSQVKEILKIQKKKRKVTRKKKTKKEVQLSEDINNLWKLGVISWKMDSNQLEMYKQYHNRGDNFDVVALYSRQTGKSYGAGIIAIEEALQNPGIVICYVAPTTKMARNIVRKNFVQILKDCPEDLDPKYNEKENEYRFRNGSLIKIYGTDNQAAEGIRGNSFDRVIIDEAGFIDKAEFDYIMTSIIIPTMVTSENPAMLYISTPPKTADHPFNKKIDAAAFEERLLVKTIYDCPRLTPERIRTIAKNTGGEDSVDFRREYLCHRIVDRDSLVIPEANEENMNEIVGEWKRPAHFTYYTAADWGVKDWNAILFAYYDFRSAMVVIEDELIINGAIHTTQDIADQIKQKEVELWGDGENHEFMNPPDMRVCDNNLQLIIDMNRLHDLSFISTRKDDKDAAINEVRIKVAGRKIRINPRCKNLIKHIKTASWNKSRKDFAHCPDGSHYDTVDALIYLVRNVMFQKNPYPHDFDVPKDSFLSDKYHESNDHRTSFEKSMTNMFSIKKFKNKK